MKSRADIDYEGLYSELGELREFKNYIYKELEKIGEDEQLGVDLKNEGNRASIFGVVNFFK